MNPAEKCYSVLVVSSSESFSNTFSELLSGPSYSTVNYVRSVSLAERALAERDIDLVIVNSPLREDNGVRFAIDAGEKGGTVAMLIVRAEIYPELCARLSGLGVFLLAKPTSMNALQTAVSWLKAAKARLGKTETRTLSLEEKMKEIRTVNRAKWLLISELSMSEPEAHRYIEKQAMDRCVAKKVIAEEIIRTYS